MQPNICTRATYHGDLDFQVEQPRRHAMDPGELDDMARRLVRTGRFLTMHKRRKKRLLTRSLCQETGLLDDLLLGQVKASGHSD
ncbi:unnamed protein product [Colias eurytheme]|nr:unnamed protein product [Colias eurytheme]